MILSLILSAILFFSVSCSTIHYQQLYESAFHSGSNEVPVNDRVLCSLTVTSVWLIEMHPNESIEAHNREIVAKKGRVDVHHREIVSFIAITWLKNKFYYVHNPYDFSIIQHIITLLLQKHTSNVVLSSGMFVLIILLHIDSVTLSTSCNTRSYVIW